MVINCPNCNKKFDIDQNLIPLNGRLLQCGSCNHKWFFKLNLNEKLNDQEIKIEKNIDSNIDIKKEKLKNKLVSDNNTNNKSKEIEVKNVNYLNILLVIILSLIALIIVLDTFKDQLTSVFPNINFLLNNLYQSFQDIKLFILDLIK